MPRRVPEETKKAYLPVSTERLWVGPPWVPEEERAAGKLPIVFDCIGVFGSGNHPTTYGCLTAVERFVCEHPGASVLDVGTGTGVLSIAAKLLGAGRVVAIDIDPPSVIEAQKNAERHGVDIEVSGQRLEDVVGVFDLVVANIRPDPLVALAAELAKRTRVRLVTSGVLPKEREPVEAAFLQTDLAVERAEVVPDFTGRFPLDSPFWLRWEYRVTGARAAP